MAKTCFIISSIGSVDSETRKKADEKLDYLFKPVLEELSYNPKRADGEDIPGSISRQIVERIINAEMVIVDISDLNPNVFYELAIRNAVNKPLIIIKSLGQKPPFDIQDSRTIDVDMSKPRIWQDAKVQLKKQIQEAEKDSKKASQSILSDFTFSISKTVKEDTDSEILRTLKDMNDRINKISTPTAFPATEKNYFTRPELFTSSPNVLRLGRQKEVKCKYCHAKFDIDLPSGYERFTIYPSPDSLKVNCPICSMENVYPLKALES